MRYTRRYIGGPADGGIDQDLESGYPSLTMKIFASDNPAPGETLDMQGAWGLYEIDRVETGPDAAERVYRYVRSGPYQELRDYMMKESRWTNP